MGLLGAALGAAVGTGDVLFMKGKITRTVTDTLGVSRQFMQLSGEAYSLVKDEGLSVVVAVVPFYAAVGYGIEEFVF